MATSERPGVRGSSAGAQQAGDDDRRLDPSIPPGGAQCRQPVRAIAALVAAALLGTFLGAGGAFLLAHGGDAGGDPFGGQVRGSAYQAVILSNDKVYFGQLRKVSDDFYQLQRAFFLREARRDEKSEPVRAVVPLIRELHAPENSMLIRADEIVVVENLDEDSPVLAEIRRQNRSR